MPSLTPSPPLSASSSRRGLVDLVAQTFAGAKTFLAATVFSAGVQLALLFNTNGSGAADVVMKLGTTLADASTNATARLLTVRTGIGATEVEYMTVSRNGTYFNGFPGSAISCSGSWIDVGSGLPVRSVSYFVSTAGTAFYASTNGGYAAPATFRAWSETAAGASDVAAKIGTTVADASVNVATKLLSVLTGIGGTEVEKFRVEKAGAYVNDILEIGGGTGTRYMDPNVVLTMNTTSKPWLFSAYDTGAMRMALTRNGRFGVGNGMSVTDLQGCSTQIVAALGTNEPTLRVRQRSTHTEPIIEGWHNFDTTPLKVWQLHPTGRVDVRGDNSATVGNETKNNPAGINTLASGATTCVITNSLVTAASHIEVTFHADPGGRVWVTKAAGSFTVTTSAAPGANAPFSWEVKGLL